MLSVTQNLRVILFPHFTGLFLFKIDTVGTKKNKYVLSYKNNLI